MKHFAILVLLSALFRFAAGQERGQPDSAATKPAKQLQEVTVRGARPPLQQSIAGSVVNVQGSMINKSSSVLNVLERSPGVVIDHRNNSIGLNGRSGVTVMIDGKLLHLPEDELLNLLNGMSADNVEKIELLTAPPSRYDASGSAGMINIVLKKNRQSGTTGSFSLYAGYGWWEKAGASLNIDHNDERTNWYGAWSFQHDHTYGGFDAEGSDNNPAIGPSSFVFHNTNSWISNNQTVSGGVDRKLGRG
jgi:outer membrane receptor for ferrienterochelin and colicin